MALKELFIYFLTVIELNQYNTIRKCIKLNEGALTLS